jgi:hypothetical protein
MSDQQLAISIGLEEKASDADLLREFTAFRTSFAELPGVSVRAGRRLPPSGSKAANAVDLTQLVMTLVPSGALIGGITKICIERIRAGVAREVHLKIGDHEIRLTAVNSQIENRALEEWKQAVLREWDAGSNG